MQNLPTRFVSFPVNVKTGQEKESLLRQYFFY